MYDDGVAPGVEVSGVAGVELAASGAVEIMLVGEGDGRLPTELYGDGDKEPTTGT